MPPQPLDTIPNLPHGDPSASPNTYINRAAEVMHVTILSKRPLVFESPLDVDEALTELIQSRTGRMGWGVLLDHPREVNPNTVQEFYGNFYDQRLTTVFLRGREIPVTEEALQRFLHILAIRDKHDYELMLERKATNNWSRVLDGIGYPGDDWESGARGTPKGIHS